MDCGSQIMRWNASGSSKLNRRQVLTQCVGFIWVRMGVCLAYSLGCPALLACTFGLKIRPNARTYLFTLRHTHSPNVVMTTNRRFLSSLRISYRSVPMEAGHHAHKPVCARRDSAINDPPACVHFSKPTLLCASYYDCPFAGP